MNDAQHRTSGTARHDSVVRDSSLKAARMSYIKRNENKTRSQAVARIADRIAS